MTDDVQGLITSISLNQVLVALLEEHTKLTVPTSKFLQVSSEEKELVIDYDENNLTFTFSLRVKG